MFYKGGFFAMIVQVVSFWLTNWLNYISYQIKFDRQPPYVLSTISDVNHSRGFPFNRQGHSDKINCVIKHDHEHKKHCRYSRLELIDLNQKVALSDTSELFITKTFLLRWQPNNLYFNIFYHNFLKMHIPVFPN